MAILPILFWGSAGYLFYTYAGYPLLVGVAAKFFARPWQQADITPSVALIIAAWNEEGVIREKLENALSLSYPRAKLQVIVASDGSNDRTVAIAREFASRGIQVLDLPRGGKTATLNRAVAQVDAEIFVFSDANVMFEQETISHLVRHFADPSIGGVSGDVRLREKGFSLGQPQGFYYRYERFIQTQESKLDSIIGADGGMYAMRRTCFRAIPEDLINDDFILSMEVVKQGLRLVYDPEAIAYEDSPIDATNEFARKSRVEHGNFQSFLRGWGIPGWDRPWLLACYLSHKVCRWMAFAPLVSAAFSSAALLSAGGVYKVAAGAQGLFYLLAFMGWKKEGEGGPALKVPYYFVLENLAALKGLSRIFTGQRSWGTARTRTREV